MCEARSGAGNTKMNEYLQDLSSIVKDPLQTSKLVQCVEDAAGKGSMEGEQQKDQRNSVGHAVRGRNKEEDMVYWKRHWQERTDLSSDSKSVIGKQMSFWTSYLTSLQLQFPCMYSSDHNTYFFRVVMKIRNNILNHTSYLAQYILLIISKRRNIDIPDT